jgi:hypothetical protein
MLDIYARHAGQSAAVVTGAEFFRIELSPLADGNIMVSLTATTVDEEEPQLLDQEIACDRVASIDDVLALIREHVHIRPNSAAPIPACLS